MSKTPLLSSLREPPVVGRYYQVPVIEDYIYFNRRDRWPVLGPLHTDKEHFGFTSPHYHVDARFLTARQRAYVARQVAFHHLSDPVSGATQGFPLNRREEPLPPGRPHLARLKCTQVMIPYLFGHQKPVQALRGDYSFPALPIRKPDGRLLCPHRKVDLSTFLPDEQGRVTCPLHGLVVQCRELAA